MLSFLIRLYYLFVPKPFFGRYVYFVVTSESAGKTGTLGVPGYVITQDNRFYYLGDTKYQVTHGIDKSRVIHWEFLDLGEGQSVNKPTKKKTSDSYDKMMDDMSTNSDYQN